jgi:anti-sigma-K factor RskA
VTEVHDLAAGYALGVLDEDERLAFDEHLRVCPECREELAGLGDAASALAYAAEGPAPRPELRDRILEAARSERTNVVPLRRRITPAWGAAAAAAACLAIGLGVWATLGTGGQATPQPETIALKGADGTLSIGIAGHAYLTVRHLRPAPAGRAYEVWVIAKGKPVPAGLFARGGSEVTVGLAQTVGRGSTVAVTLERAGGSSRPTGPILFQATVPV